MAANIDTTFVPKNEQGVIVVFQQVCADMGFKVKSIQVTYPDVTLYDCATDTEFNAEFEYHANNFVTHKHDPKDIQLIICWERGRRKLPVPVLELSTFTTYPPSMYARSQMEDLKSISNSTKSNGNPSHYFRTIFRTNNWPMAYIRARRDGSEVMISVMGDTEDGRMRSLDFTATRDDNSKQADAIRALASQAEEWGKNGQHNQQKSQEFVNAVRKLYYEYFQLQKAE